MPGKKHTKRQTKKYSKKPGFVGWAIIFLSVFIAVFAISMMMTPSQVAVTKKAPEMVRLQILNGCGSSGAVEAVAKAFTAASNQVFVDIIDKANADIYNFEKTLVVDRRGENGVGGYSKSAALVAEMLKVNPENLIIQRLSDNLLDIDVTIILGADYQGIIENMKKGKTAVDS
jgi:hypothetical protein